MVKRVEITTMAADEAAVLRVLKHDLGLTNLTQLQGVNSVIVTARVDDSDLQNVLAALQRSGVGVAYGLVEVIEVITSTYTRRHPDRALCLPNSSSLPATQMYERLLSGALLTYDHLALLVLSSLIAGVGLASENSTFVIASMLISPLMGPLVGAAFAAAIEDRRLFLDALKNLLLAIVIIVCLGAAVGAAFTPYGEDLLWPTSEMSSRGEFIQAALSGIVAVAGGVTVAISEVNVNVSSVVGTAIAAALLPPATNAGLCLAYAYLGPDTIDQALFLEIAIGSGLLVVLNVVFIFVAALACFRVKSVSQWDFVQRDFEADDLPEPSNRRRGFRRVFRSKFKRRGSNSAKRSNSFRQLQLKSYLRLGVPASFRDQALPEDGVEPGTAVEVSPVVAAAAAEDSNAVSGAEAISNGAAEAEAEAEEKKPEEQKPEQPEEEEEEQQQQETAPVKAGKGKKGKGKKTKRVSSN